MNAHPCEGLLPKRRKMAYMSYQYGSHMPPPTIYFGGDGFVVSEESECVRYDPPAWLVADWMIARKRGETLSQTALHFATMDEKPACLKWLSNCLSQYEAT